MINSEPAENPFVLSCVRERKFKPGVTKKVRIKKVQQQIKSIFRKQEEEISKTDQK